MVHYLWLQVQMENMIQKVASYGETTYLLKVMILSIGELHMG